MMATHCRWICVAGAQALLFPSIAEGFGLPPIEALMLGTPVICNDLPVFHEILGKSPIYANAADMYLLKQSVLHLAGRKRAEKARQAGKTQGFYAPTWTAHFNQVLKLV